LKNICGIFGKDICEFEKYIGILKRFVDLRKIFVNFEKYIVV
tara:strand:- start:135 stop:260 length:126 start_codon:yes stop_codon:yes gene_type:complete